MNLLIASHLWGAIFLLITVIAGLASKTEKRIKVWLMWSRVLYMIMIISGVIEAARTFSHAPLLTIIKGLFGIILIGLIEIVFARKQETHVTTTLYWLLGAGFLLTIILGVSLHIFS
ncbi:DUF1516 family protein [Furfurilactobacillus entadae]|uniref:DUF1516 family protein n=1 Tax=Furfurilactobacillus entadae TaxID=2922307 RepID=UPI0035EBCAF3